MFMPEADGNLSKINFRIRVIKSKKSLLMYLEKSSGKLSRQAAPFRGSEPAPDLRTIKLDNIYLDMYKNCHQPFIKCQSNKFA